MVSWKQDFIERSNSQAKSIELLRDLSGTMAESIERIQYTTLSNGLMVQIYSSLEMFLKECAIYHLKKLENSGVGFSDLPEKFRRRSQIPVLESAIKRYKIEKNIDSDQALRNLLDASASVGATASEDLSISKYFFGYEGSNITPDEVKDFFKNLDVAGGVEDIFNKIVTVVDVGVIGSFDHLRTAYDHRNNAAHNPKTEIDFSTINSYPGSLLAFAIAFDVSVAVAVKMLKESKDQQSWSNRMDFKYHDLDLHRVRVVKDGSSYKIYTSISSNRARKVFSSMAGVETYIRSRPAYYNKILLIVVKDKHERHVIDWQVIDTTR